MNIEEFMQLCDEEGGIMEAVFGYGLDESDLDDSLIDTEFYKTVQDLAQYRPKIDSLLGVMYRIYGEDSDIKD